MATKCPYCHFETVHTLGGDEKQPIEFLHYLQRDSWLRNFYLFISDEKTLCFGFESLDGRYGDNLNINYCPMCGRKLTKKND